MWDQIIEYRYVQTSLLQITYTVCYTLIQIGSIGPGTYFDMVVVDYENQEIRFCDRYGQLIEKVGFSISLSNTK